MKIKCDYCGTFINDTDEKCPNCGAPNDHLARSAKGVPKTIEELKAFCEARNLPLDKMRFFIGENYQGARAFGIYKDEDGHFVVYKNKSDGSRAVRYQGYDEAYAVNEIYQKLHSEVVKQREYKASSASSSQPTRRSSGVNPTTLIAVILFIILFVVTAFMQMRGKPKRGYYSYGDETYYYGGGTWYGYNDALSSWFPTIITNDSDLYGNSGDYWEGSDYSDSWGASDFSRSEYYQDSLDRDSDWDDDDDWDWGGSDWDSGSTDWDSDW